MGVIVIIVTITDASCRTGYSYPSWIITSVFKHAKAWCLYLYCSEFVCCWLNWV